MNRINGFPINGFPAPEGEIGVLQTQLKEIADSQSHTLCILAMIGESEAIGRCRKKIEKEIASTKLEAISLALAIRPFLINFIQGGTTQDRSLLEQRFSNLQTLTDDQETIEEFLKGLPTEIPISDPDLPEVLQILSEQLISKLQYRSDWYSESEKLEWCHCFRFENGKPTLFHSKSSVCGIFRQTFYRTLFDILYTN